MKKANKNEKQQQRQKTGKSENKNKNMKTISPRFEECRRRPSSGGRGLLRSPEVHQTRLPEVDVLFNFAVPVNTSQRIHLRSFPLISTAVNQIARGSQHGPDPQTDYVRTLGTGGIKQIDRPDRRNQAVVSPADRPGLGPVSPTSSTVAVDVHLHRAWVGAQGFELAQHKRSSLARFLDIKKIYVK